MNFDDFDPNAPIDDGKTPVYGVYKGGTTMKTYTARAHALSSFVHGYQAKLYQFVSGRWVEIAYRDCRYKPHGTCDLCGGLTKRPYKGASWTVETGRWCWNKASGKIVEPLTLYYACGECRSARGL